MKHSAEWQDGVVGRKQLLHETGHNNICDFLNDAEIIIIFGCTACYLDPFIRPISPEPDKPHQNNNDDTRRTAIKIKGHWFECSIVLLNI